MLRLNVKSAKKVSENNVETNTKNKDRENVSLFNHSICLVDFLFHLRRLPANPFLPFFVAPRFFFHLDFDVLLRELDLVE